MRLTIERDAALTAVAKVRGASSPKSTIPILGFVLLGAANGELILTATNLDMQARMRAACQVEASGTIAVSANLLHDMLKSLPSGGEVGLRLSDNGGRLEVICGRSRLELPTLPASDFPAFPFDGPACVGEMGGAALARMIDRTRFAISTEETRRYLGGLFLHAAASPAGPCLRAVATNGHQLAWADIELPELSGDLPGAILPRNLVAELRRLIEPGDTVTFAIAETLVRFTVGAVELTGKVIDGSFPDYMRAIPAGEAARVRTSRAGMLAALKRAQLVARDKDRTFTLRAKAGSLEIVARSLDMGAASDDVPAAYGGEPFTRNYNSAYLAEMVELISGDDVDLTFHEGGGRLTITEEADPASMLLLVGHKTGGQG